MNYVDKQRRDNTRQIYDVPVALLGLTDDAYQLSLVKGPEMFP